MSMMIVRSLIVGEVSSTEHPLLWTTSCRFMHMHVHSTQSAPRVTAFAVHRLNRTTDFRWFDSYDVNSGKLHS